MLYEHPNMTHQKAIIDTYQTMGLLMIDAMEETKKRCVVMVWITTALYRLGVGIVVNRKP